MRQQTRGFTLVELLVVIAIIGVLVAMTMPALMASRETGRRSLCNSRLAQVLLAAQGYENAFEAFPAGVINPDGPIRSEAMGLHKGWTIAILPYLDLQNAYNSIDQSKSVYDPANDTVRQFWPNTLICPSDPEDVRGASNYAGCHHDVEAPIAADNHGLLFLNSHVRRDDVTDGLGHTLLVGEKRADLADLGWMSGTRATLRNTGLGPNQNNAEPAGAQTDPLHVGGFGSAHPGGLHVGFGDASVRFFTDEVDMKLWQQLANRADGALVNLPANGE